MWHNLEPGSSPIDWCEGNYSITPLIAEFVNTFSNFLFFLLPPVLIHLFKEYARFVNPAIHVIWILLIVVGISSAYFHATLSLIGQLLDEVAILWVFMAAFSLFFPRRFFPYFFHNDRKLFSMAAVVLAIFATGLGCLHPAANAFALMSLGFPAFLLLIHQLRRCRCERVFRLGIRCAAIWMLAVTCWVTDRLFCDAWSSINFPYLHGLWHIFIFIASYTACVLFAYFSVKDERPEQTPILKYWPRDDFELGIPYVSIRCYYKSVSNNEI
ncbi:alkaline ceramidase [Hetaerina americana]|uniref:alkaline ceramidase n=1 Tax=Hetaerina americana TaxID=62018 RepID=UPI003A7F3A92